MLKSKTHQRTVSVNLYNLTYFLKVGRTIEITVFTIMSKNIGVQCSICWGLRVLPLWVLHPLSGLVKK